MLRKIQKVVIALVVLGAIAIGSAVIANAASNGTAGSGTGSSNGSSSGSSQNGQSGATQGAPPARQAETPLTGDTADKVKQAAEAEVSGGTVLRVETDADGSPYEAHVRKSNGTEVVVKVDKDFKATDVQEFGAAGRGGPGHGPPGGPAGGPGGPGPGETPLTGDTADKVKQAAEAEVSGGTVLRVETDADGSPYEAHVRKSNGTEVVVKVDTDFKATDVQQLGAPGRTG